MALGALNSRTLNTAAINVGAALVLPPVIPVEDICLGEFNAAPVNSYEVNGCRFLTTMSPEVILRFAQLVGVGVEQVVVTFSQIVELRMAISGTVLTYQQEVQTILPSANACTFTQIIDAPGSFLDVYGWDATISIAGVQIPKDRLSGNVVITKESNQNTLCEFKVRVALPLDFIDFIDGGAVIVNYVDSDGGHRLFTGVVDLPEVDLINKWITIKCSDRREELIKAKMLPLLPTIGRYSKEVQGDITSVGNEMEYRLQTVPKDVDFDSYNTPNINSWYAKASADYVYSNADVYYQEPKLSWQSRGAIVNDVTVIVKYQYPRLYHYQRPFSWNTSATIVTQIPVGDHEDGYSFPTVGMIKSAIDGAGWKQNNTLSYTESASNFWITFQRVQSSTLRPYAGGTFGPEQLMSIRHHLENVDSYEVTYAAWEGSTRFAQTVEETYTLTVKSTQSINQYGELTAFSNYEVKADFDTHTWENYKLVTAAPSDAITSNLSYRVDKDINKDAKNLAILTGIDKAKTQIIASHRDTKVTLQVPIKPDLELRHTLEIDTTPLACKGKVVRIVHTLNLPERKGHSTDIEIALFRARSSASTTASTVPAKPVDVVSIPSSTVVLGNHLGYDYDTLPETTTQVWNGFVGNTIFPPTRFTEKFIVDTPSAPSDLRDLRKLAASGTYEVALPNDDLDIIF